MNFPFFKNKPNARDVAKDRLRLVLIHDRTNCSPDMLERMKADLIKVISNYLEIDESDVDLQISKGELDGETGAPALQANIPIKSIKQASGR